MTQLLTIEQLQAIEARVEATQPGPWTSCVEGRDHVSGSSFIMTGDGNLRGDDIELIGATIADQDFMAAAHQDIPLLLAEVRALRALLGVDGDEVCNAAVPPSLRDTEPLVSAGGRAKGLGKS